MHYKEAYNCSILVTLVGSRAYGTHTPESDYDTKGVCIPSKEYFLGLRDFEQATNTQDHVIYNIQKFFSLALKTNPNIFDVLWSEDVLRITPLGEKLRAERDIFLSRRVRYSFSGYAAAQLKRIKNHRGYLLGNHPEGPPDPKDFGIQPTWKIGEDELRVLESVALSVVEELEEQAHRRAYTVGESGKISFNKTKATDTFLKVLTKEKAVETAFLKGISRDVMAAFWRVKAYQSELREWKKYQEWKRNRNPERAELENKYGLDVKHAMHLIRLLRQGAEILNGKGVIVKRPDAEELKAIRNGAWTYEQVVEHAEKMEAQLADDYANSPLPNKPNAKRAEELLIELVEEACGA